ncbi:hypothetical protein [uncultured Methanospirillum sp.]|uniref:hypothetical protein n=1 Tax=uncultured Methanospirillum sp. TaxID=262503 RepID=UPI0029C771A9|nr:hypothetical protein [uncultured Methanospirillum sp.]
MLIADISTLPYQEVMDKSLLGELFHPKQFADQVSTRYSIAHARVAAGKTTLPHTLLRSSEVYYILQGTGLMHIGVEVESNINRTTRVHTSRRGPVHREHRGR